MRLRRMTKEEIRAKNEPPKLTTLEEVGNAITHGVGAGLSVTAFVLMLLKSDTGLKIMASCFYGICLILLFLMSCLYHAWKSGLTVKRLWRRFDYSSIYLLIGGTFAPMCLVYWGGDHDHRHIRARTLHAAAFYAVLRDRVERAAVRARHDPA